MKKTHHKEKNTFYWENITSKRYYFAYLQQDLLKDWVVVTGWGRKSSRLGGQRQLICQSYEQGVIRLNTIQKRRQQRQYQLIPHNFFNLNYET